MYTPIIVGQIFIKFFPIIENPRVNHRDIIIEPLGFILFILYKSKISKDVIDEFKRVAPIPPTYI